MELSEKRRSDLYAAISEPIMQKRLVVARSENVLGKQNTKDIDALLYQLERNIWREVRKALNISGS